jgi:hypothetical protein
MCIMGCGKKKFRNTPLVNNPVCIAISIETPPVDCQFGNAAKMFIVIFLTIFANLDFYIKFYIPTRVVQHLPFLRLHV